MSNKLDPAGLAFFKSTFRNAKCKKPSWSITEKVFALVLYRRGPKCYNLLKRCIPLPSKTTLQSLLKKVPFQPGINNHCLKKLEHRISKMHVLYRKCTLKFDETFLAQQLTFDITRDKIVGFVDLGTVGRQNEYANHGLVFLIHGVRKTWKQPLAYYFTKNCIKTNNLVFILKEIITSLQNIGLTVVATVCDF